MGLTLDYTDAQTPHEEEEPKRSLTPTIITRGELDEFEQHNIEKAVEWSIRTKLGCEKILT